MNSIESRPLPRSLVAEDMIDKIIDVDEEMSRLRRSSEIPVGIIHSKIHDLWLERDKFLLGALMARGGIYMSDFRVTVFQPEEPPLNHPFRADTFYVDSMGDNDRKRVYSDFLTMAKAYGGDSDDVARIIGKPDFIKLEGADSEVVRLITEFKSLRKAINTTPDHQERIQLRTFQKVLVDRLTELRLSEKAQNLSIGLDEATNRVQFKAKNNRGHFVSIFSDIDDLTRSKIISRIIEYDFKIHPVEDF